MKENYQNCLEIILHHEGGYVNHPEDPGMKLTLVSPKGFMKNGVEQKT